MSRELDTQRARHLHNGREAQLGAWRQRLVETFTAQARLFGDLRHAICSGYIVEREEQQVQVIGFEHGNHVRGNQFVVVEIPRRMMPDWSNGNAGLPASSEHAFGSQPY